jgi:hypothetical protein
MNKQQTCRGLSFHVGWMGGTLVYDLYKVVSTFESRFEVVTIFLIILGVHVNILVVTTVEIS